MSFVTFKNKSLTKYEQRSATRESNVIKYTILGVSLAFFAFFLLLPLIAVFAEGLRKGVEVYFRALIDSGTLSALKLIQLI